MSINKLIIFCALVMLAHSLEIEICGKGMVKDSWKELYYINLQHCVNKGYDSDYFVQNKDYCKPLGSEKTHWGDEQKGLCFEKIIRMDNYFGSSWLILDAVESKMNDTIGRVEVRLVELEKNPNITKKANDKGGAFQFVAKK